MRQRIEFRENVRASLEEKKTFRNNEESVNWGSLSPFFSLRASSPVWASETGLARTRERAAKPRGAERSREARFAWRACSQAIHF